jgi:hypothetical protein
MSCPSFKEAMTSKRSAKLPRERIDPVKSAVTQPSTTGETPESMFKFTSLANAAIAAGVDLGTIFNRIPVRRWLLALLTSVIDPEGVRQAELTGTLPAGFHTAIHLLSKINVFLSAQPEGLLQPEDAAEGRKMHQVIRDQRRLSIEHEWRLNEGRRFTLEQAVDLNERKWCTYKTVRNLRKLLKRVSFPFDYFESEPFITEAAYQKALEADRERERTQDRNRKKTTKKEIATGNSMPTVRKLRPSSGKKGRTSRKLKATSYT